MIMTESDLKIAVKQRRRGVFVLCGVESYLIRHYRDEFRAPYTGDAAFDRAVVAYESQTDAADIINEAATPMMSVFSLMSDMSGGDTGARSRLVEISVDSLDSLSASDTDALLAALSEAASYDSAIVLLCLLPGTFDCGEPPKRPSSTYKKLIAADGVNVVYFPETTPAQLRRWIERHITHCALTPDHDAADAMISFCGSDMTSLSFEIDKLVSYVKSRGKSSVSAADVEAVCCRGERYDAFALSNAILDGRRDAALAALADERRRKTEPVIVSAAVARVISDIMAVKLLMDGGASASAISSKLGMHEYKVKLYMKSASLRSNESIAKAVLACADADRRLKSTGAGYEALERLVCSVDAK